MSLVNARRFGVLDVVVPELFRQAGTLLYVGANERRFDFSLELYKAGHEITVLEVWGPAARGLMESRFKERIAHLVVGDVCDAETLSLPHDRYDFSFWWHGPEHISADYFVGAVKALESRTKRLVVLGSPWGRAPEQMVYGNPHNAHKAYLYYEDYAALHYEVATLGPKNKMGGCLIAWRWLSGP